MNKRYYVKEPKGIYLTESVIWGLAEGLDISIPFKNTLLKWIAYRKIST
ncbi:hypothetical protein [Mycoplasma sp. 4F]